MLPVFLLLVFSSFYQESVEAEPASSPLFDFWNPLTWLNPKFSAEAMFHILRSGREADGRGLYQQLKKALLPANLFIGNIRTQYAAWDSGKEKKPQSSKGSVRPNKKFSKNSPGKPE